MSVIWEGHRYLTNHQDIFSLPNPEKNVRHGDFLSSGGVPNSNISQGFFAHLLEGKQQFPEILNGPLFAYCLVSYLTLSIWHFLLILFGFLWDRFIIWLCHDEHWRTGKKRASFFKAALSWMFWEWWNWISVYSPDQVMGDGSRCWDLPTRHTHESTSSAMKQKEIQFARHWQKQLNTI